MKIGYARVSTADQNLDLQIVELEKAGCEQIFQEKLSGKNTDRPEYKSMLSQLRKGDQVVVWKLDRIGRSIKDLIEIVDSFKSKGVDFVCLHNHIDTSTPNGRFIFTVFAALAEFERELIVERTKAGMQAASIRGRKPGRRAGLSEANEKKAKRAYELYKKGTLSIEELAIMQQVGKSTMYRYIRYMEELNLQDISDYKIKT